jgi:putative flippase GtrA
VFDARDEKASIQMVRYGFVWLGYLLLTTFSMYLITHFTNMNYIIAKVLVSLAMAVLYNYPLQKKYVFA